MSTPADPFENEHKVLLFLESRARMRQDGIDAPLDLDVIGPTMIEIVARAELERRLRPFRGSIRFNEDPTLPEDSDWEALRE